MNNAISSEQDFIKLLLQVPPLDRNLVLIKLKDISEDKHILGFIWL